MGEKQTVEVVVECWIVSIYEGGVLARTFPRSFDETQAKAFARVYGNPELPTGSKAVAQAARVTVHVPRVA